MQGEGSSRSTHLQVIQEVGRAAADNQNARTRERENEKTARTNEKNARTHPPPVV